MHDIKGTYNIYNTPPNLGLGIAVLGQEGMQGHFRRSTEGARTEGARGSTIG